MSHRIFSSSEFGGEDGGSGGDSDIRGTCVDLPLARWNTAVTNTEPARDKLSQKGKENRTFLLFARTLET
jgi:hypothetical protein